MAKKLVGGGVLDDAELRHRAVCRRADRRQRLGMTAVLTQGVGKVHYVRPDLRRWRAEARIESLGRPCGSPACKVIALPLARSARPSGLSASDISTSVARRHRLSSRIRAGQAPW